MKRISNFHPSFAQELFIPVFEISLVRPQVTGDPILCQQKNTAPSHHLAKHNIPETSFSCNTRFLQGASSAGLSLEQSSASASHPLFHAWREIISRGHCQDVE